MGEVEVHLVARGRVHLIEIRETWLRLKKVGRMTRPMIHLAETLKDLAEILKDLAETTGMADGRPLLE